MKFEKCNLYQFLNRGVVSLAVHKRNPFTIYNIKPESIRFVTPASGYTDLNQHDADRSHPHAFYDRGYFEQKKRIGSVLGGDWDKPDLKFNDLIEFEAIKDHLAGDVAWNKSRFAVRVTEYIDAGGTAWGYDNSNEFLEGREREILRMIDKFQTDGIKPSKILGFDQIDVNVARNGELLFNNHGHHRLSIAKLIGLETVPVVVTVWHDMWVKQHGFDLRSDYKST